MAQISQLRTTAHSEFRFYTLCVPGFARKWGLLLLHRYFDAIFRVRTFIVFGHMSPWPDRWQSVVGGLARYIIMIIFSSCSTFWRRKEIGNTHSVRSPGTDKRRRRHRDKNQQSSMSSYIIILCVAYKLRGGYALICYIAVSSLTTIGWRR